MMKRIFVSSTFRDMQYERDLFHTVITPKLNGYARKYGESLSFCDLRWGVNTSELESEEGAKKVLSVCLNEIDRCKPYMVVLLGDRYGWVPDQKLIKDAADKKHFDMDDPEKSVTALEIEYGALRDESQLSRTLFYFREFENESPAEYGSSDEADALRLKELKERIVRIAGDRVRTYQVKIDHDGKTLLGLDSFADRVVEDIKEMMEDEWKEYAALPLHEKINRSQWNLAKNKAERFIDLNHYADEVFNRLSLRHSVTVYGDEGSGKSMLMGYLAVQLLEKGYDVIPAFCGSTEHMSSSVQIQAHILYLLEQRLREQHMEFDLNTENGIEKLRNRCKSAIKLYDEKMTKKLVIIVDGSESLGSDFIHGKQSVFEIITKTVASKENYEALNFWEKDLYLDDLQPERIPDMINLILQSSGKELSAPVSQKICEKKNSISPQYLTLVLRYLEMMDKSDFDVIRAYGDDIEAITKYQTEVIDSIPDDYMAAAFNFVNKAIDLFGGDPLREILEYIAICPQGMPLYAFERLSADYGMQVSTLNFSIFMNYVDGMMGIDEKNFIVFLDRKLKDGILSRCPNIKEKRKNIINFYRNTKYDRCAENVYNITALLSDFYLDEKDESALVDYMEWAYDSDHHAITAQSIRGHFDSKTRYELFASILNDASHDKYRNVLTVADFLQSKYSELFEWEDFEHKSMLLELTADVLLKYETENEDIIRTVLLARCYHEMGNVLMRQMEHSAKNFEEQQGFRLPVEDIPYFKRATDFFEKALLYHSSVVECRGDEYDYRRLSRLYASFLSVYSYVYMHCELNEKISNEIAARQYNLCDDWIALAESTYEKFPNEDTLYDLNSAYGHSRLIPWEDKAKEFRNIKRYYETYKLLHKRSNCSERELEDYINLKKCSQLPDLALLSEIQERFQAMATQYRKEAFSDFKKASENHELMAWTNYFTTHNNFMYFMKRFIDEYDFRPELLNLFENYKKAFAMIREDFKGWDRLKSQKLFSSVYDYLDEWIQVYCDQIKGDDARSVLNDAAEAIAFIYENIELKKPNPDVWSLMGFQNQYSKVIKYLFKGDELAKADAFRLAHNLYRLTEELGDKHDWNGDWSYRFFDSVLILAELHFDMNTPDGTEKAIEYCNFILYGTDRCVSPATKKSAKQMIARAYIRLDADFYFVDIMKECCNLVADELDTFDNKHKSNSAWKKCCMLIKMIEEIFPALEESKKALASPRIVEWISAYAERNIAEASYQLAEHYYRGLHGVQKDYTTAFRFYLEAAEQGHALSQCYVAGFYHLGQGIEKNDAKAFIWFKKAADNGMIDAMTSLGAFYMNGTGVDKDYTQAFQYLSKACEHDRPPAQHNMGVLYFNGWGVERNHETAISWFEKAAQNGSSDSQKLLAKLYKEGNFVTKDLTKAFTWYFKLAEKNNAEAQNEIGDAYYYGRGVEKNYENAFVWYLKSAQNGNKFAQYSTGFAYKNSQGCEHDYAKAFEWFMKAANQGLASAQNEIGDAYYYGRGTEKNYESAFAWYLKSAQNGNKFAQYSTGFAYKNSQGCEQDYAKAFEWFLKASQQGYYPAQYEIGYCYECGLGVEKNTEQAILWYQKSSEKGSKKAKTALERLRV